MLGNQLLMSAVTGWVVAQFLKTLIDFALNKNFNAERLVGSGGMPSSHSATVCGLTTAALLKYGAGSFEFAVSFVLSMIVMYDAIGVRRETANKEMLNFDPSQKIHINAHGFRSFGVDGEGFRLGCGPLQVLAGAILGIGLALALNSYY